MGILRRAFERGKALPKKLERALKIQAGLALPDGQITDIDQAYGKKNSQPTQVPVAERRSPYSAMGLYNEDAKT